MHSHCKWHTKNIELNYLQDSQNNLDIKIE